MDAIRGNLRVSVGRRLAIVVALIAAAVLSPWIWQWAIVDGSEIELPDKPESELGALGLLARWRLKSVPLEQEIIKAVRAGDLAKAEKWCRELTEQVPRAPESFYKLAAVLAVQDKKDESFQALEQAVELGFRDARRISQDIDLTTLRDDERLAAVIADCQRRPPIKIGVAAQPVDIEQGKALVADSNSAYEPAHGLFRPLFNPLPPLTERGEWTPARDEAMKLLAQWWDEGTAAGNRADFYDNRDNGHSKLSRDDFPQLTFIEYGPEARALTLHWGLPRGILHNGVVLGNASVASVGDDFWRSMPRAAVSNPYDMSMLLAQFSGNQLYVYPSHHDYLQGHNETLQEGKKDGDGHGDVYFANTPYLLTSRGSSGSDQRFLKALALTMASFQPEVKEFLIENRALSPTLQMIFRSSSRMLREDADYFTGKAHPPVFSHEWIDEEKMVRMAHEMTRSAVPPIVSLRVLEETKDPTLGQDVFDPLVSERLFDTPQAIARIFRGTAQRRRLVVSAEESRDLSGQPLKWRWAVLGGKANAIEIKPLNEDSSRVELSVPWHDRRSIEWTMNLESNRIDIGCFVSNGTNWSCPGFVTFYCPDNEQRVYDDEGRLETITYNLHYADPVIVIRKEWRDEYEYNPEGSLVGWTRIRDNSRQQFTATGERIIESASGDQPAKTRKVKYNVRQKGRTRYVEQVDAE